MCTRGGSQSTNRRSESNNRRGPTRSTTDTVSTVNSLESISTSSRAELSPIARLRTLLETNVELNGAVNSPAESSSTSSVSSCSKKRQFSPTTSTRKNQPEPSFNLSQESSICSKQKPILYLTPKLTILPKQEPVFNSNTEPSFASNLKSGFESLTPTQKPVIKLTPEPTFKPKPKPLFELTQEPVLNSTPKQSLTPKQKPAFKLQPDPVLTPKPKPLFNSTPESSFTSKSESVFESMPGPGIKLTPEPTLTPRSIPVFNSTPKSAFKPLALSQTSKTPECNGSTIESYTTRNQCSTTNYINNHEELNSNMNPSSEASSASEELTSNDIFKDPYSHFLSHEAYLKDGALVDLYITLIKLNRPYINDKSVMEISCGVGMLSLMAFHAGAKIVYAIEKSKILHLTRQVVQANDPCGIIHLVKGHVNNLKLNVKNIDFLMYFWRRNTSVFECLKTVIPNLITARYKWLSPTGSIIPSTVKVYLVGIEFDKIERNRLWWQNVAGFNMERIAEASLKIPTIENIHEEDVLTRPLLLRDIRLKTATHQDVMNMDIINNITVVKKGFIDAVAIYTSVLLKVGDVQRNISMSPLKDGFHPCLQTVLVLPTRVPVHENDVCSIRFMFRAKSGAQTYCSFKICNDKDWYQNDIFYTYDVDQMGA